MVWRESFEPRILDITAITTSPRRPTTMVIQSFTGQDTARFRFKSREMAPIALQICHESRAFALKHYMSAFHSRTIPLEHASETKQTALYFNPELDTVHIAETKHSVEFWALCNVVDKETMEGLKTWPSKTRILTTSGRNILQEKLIAFVRLETLIFVVGDETGTDGDGWGGIF
jgi:hypothetical protein